MNRSVSKGIRLSQRQWSQLAQIAERNGVDVSQLVRWSVDALIEHIERHDGRLHLPIDFSESWEKKDSGLRAAEDPGEYPGEKPKAG